MLEDDLKTQLQAYLERLQRPVVLVASVDDGTKSGEIPGYAFSDAMKSANLTWDEATLDKYLAAPAKVVPGTKMTYAGLADPAARKAIIEYLKTLK